jgi:hypothetical protein
MPSRILVSGVLIALWIAPGFVFGQAAAEYGALAGSLASTTAKAGSSLGRSTRLALRRLQQRMPQPSRGVPAQTARTRTGKNQSTSTAMHTRSTQGALFLSLAGGQAGCTADTGKRSGVRSTDCKHETANPKHQNKYPSAVSISFGH